MKKLLCALFLLISLAVPAFAESFAVPASDADVKIMLEEMYSSMGLDYCNVILNEEKKIFVIDMAVDGLASNLIARKRLGLSGDELWAQCRTNLEQMHDFVLEAFKIIGREDLRLILNMVNDDVYLRDDYENIRYNPLLSVGIFGTVDIDVMSE